MADIFKVRNFTRDQDFDAFSIVRVNNGLLQDLGGRNAWVSIGNGSKVLYRRARGCGDIAGLSKEAIELDYDSRLELGATTSRDIDGFFSASLTIQSASLVERFRAHWSNPSIEYRAPFQIAMIGLLLGVLGALMGAVALFK